MYVYLIRHGMTKGNLEHRYVGTTDESLLPGEEEKMKELKEDLFRELNPDSYGWNLYVSPRKRCSETAEILFPQKTQIVNKALRETDFGAFEYKNYEELRDNPDYQAWLDGGGAGAFPGGETNDQFRRRVRHGFLECMWDAVKEDCEAVVFLVHGGTIMAILDAFSDPHEDFYCWQVKNGCGFQMKLGSLDTEECSLKLVRKIPEEREQ